MRHSRRLASAVCAALLLATALAVSAQAVQPSAGYPVFRADCGVDLSNARIWESDGVLHIRGVVTYHTNYFLVDGEWEESGTNTVIANLNGRNAWGTSEIRDTIVGDYDSSWTWGSNPVGSAAGHGVGDSAGMHIKIDLLGERPAGLPDPPDVAPCDSGWELWSVH